MKIINKSKYLYVLVLIMILLFGCNDKNLEINDIQSNIEIVEKEIIIETVGENIIDLRDMDLINALDIKRPEGIIIDSLLYDKEYGSFSMKFYLDGDYIRIEDIDGDMTEINIYNPEKDITYNYFEETNSGFFDKGNHTDLITMFLSLDLLEMTSNSDIEAFIDKESNNLVMNFDQYGYNMTYIYSTKYFIPLSYIGKIDGEVYLTYEVLDLKENQKIEKKLFENEENRVFFEQDLD